MYWYHQQVIQKSDANIDNLFQFSFFIEINIKTELCLLNKIICNNLQVEEGLCQSMLHTGD